MSRDNKTILKVLGMAIIWCAIMVVAVLLAFPKGF